MPYKYHKIKNLIHILCLHFVCFVQLSGQYQVYKAYVVPTGDVIINQEEGSIVLIHYYNQSTDTLTFVEDTINQQYIVEETGASLLMLSDQTFRLKYESGLGKSVHLSLKNPIVLEAVTVSLDQDDTQGEITQLIYNGDTLHQVEAWQIRNVAELKLTDYVSWMVIDWINTNYISGRCVFQNIGEQSTYTKAFLIDTEANEVLNPQIAMQPKYLNKISCDWVSYTPNGWLCGEGWSIYSGWSQQHYWNKSNTASTDQLWFQKP